MLAYNTKHLQYGFSMKKALHQEEKVFFSFRDGELTAWRTHDVETLVAAANDTPNCEVIERNGISLLTRNGKVVERFTHEEAFCTALFDLMSDLVNPRCQDRCRLF
jgi:hypothetical protein